jgi:hypothetical protein
MQEHDLVFRNDVLEFLRIKLSMLIAHFLISALGFQLPDLAIL